MEKENREKELELAREQRKIKELEKEIKRREWEKAREERKAEEEHTKREKIKAKKETKLKKMEIKEKKRREKKEKKEIKRKERIIDRIIRVSPLLLIVSFGLIGPFLVLRQIFLWGGIFTGIAVILLIVCLRNIPATPPHVGVVTIWGKRKPIVKEEGWKLFAPFFPLLYEAVLVNVEKKNKDFIFPDIRTALRREEKKTEEEGEKQSRENKEIPRAGGELTIEISLTYEPDYKSDEAGKRLIAYINSGGEPGVDNIVRDLIAEDIREMGAEKHWEAITFGRDELTWRLLEKLTGKEIPEGKEAQKTATRELQTNGFPDVMDLGIRISRFNVGRIKEQGELAKAAETAAKEKQEREGEKVELFHVKDRTKELQELGLSAKDAIEVVQTERGKVKKEIREYKGLEGLGEGVGRVLGQILGKK